MTGKRLRAADKAEIVRLRIEDRLSIPEIARVMGRSNTVVWEIVKPFPLTPEEVRAKKHPSTVAMHKALVAKGNYVGGEDWSEQENATLTKAWPVRTRAHIQKLFPGRTWAAIGKHAGGLGLRRSKSVSRVLKRKPDKFFQMLREIREARGLTREEVAQRAGLHRVQLAKYELGENRPEWLNLRAWLGALRYDIQPIAIDAAERVRGTRQWLTEEEAMMKELLNQGSTIPDVSLALKRPLNEVERRARTLGLLESEATRNVSGMTRMRLS